MDRVIEGFQVSPQQRAFWPLVQAGGALARARATVLVEGELDSQRLRRALGQVVEQHEILRTRFEQLPGMALPLQVVLGAGEAWQHAEDGTDQNTEPQQGPDGAAAERVFCTSLIDLPEAGSLLSIDLPALSTDRPGLRLLVAEICRAYRDDGAAPTATEEGLQYAELASWQDELLSSDEYTEDHQFWRQREPAARDACQLQLPWRAVGDGRAGFAPLHEEGRIDPATRQRLEQLAQDAGSSLERLALAAWVVLLSRSLGVSEFAIGLTCDGRAYEELAEQLGLLSRSVPVACEVGPAESFETLLARLDREASAAAEMQEFFTWGRTASAGGEELPYAVCGFAFEAAPPSFEAAGVSFRLQTGQVFSERFDLRLVVGEQSEPDEPLRLELQYDSGRLGAPVVTRLLRRYQQLMGRLAEHLGVTCGAVEILDPVERQQLMELNQTEVDWRHDLGLHELFAARAARSPEQIAVSSADRSLTYAELATASGHLTRRLRRLGAGPDQRVAICAERGLDMIVGLLAILETGAAYLPLAPDLPGRRLAFVLEESAACLLVTQRQLADRLPLTAATIVLLDDEDHLEQPEANDRAEALPPFPSSARLAYVIYTSGSSGRPKGVMVSQRAIVNRLLWMARRFPVNVSDRVLLKTPFGFDASIWEIFLPLISGAELVVARPDGHRDTAYLAAEIVRRKITVLQGVPSLLRLLVAEPGFAACTSLRLVFSGGEALPADLEHRIREVCSATVCNLYGPTEVSIDATYHLCGGPRRAAVVPIGRPLDNVRTYVLDARLRALPSELPGELLVGGVGLARGYLGRPALTAQSFVPDPFGPLGSRLYKTGDLARRRIDGVLEFRGRIDHQVKLRGFRIEIGEVEAVLERHPAVRQVVVVLRDDGSEEPRLVAYVVPAGAEEPPPAADLRAFLGTRLPEYMLPANLIELDELPLLRSGKVDRQALPAEGAQWLKRATFVAPRTAHERALAKVWAEVLGVAEVGAEDNFFELGGDSILSLQVLAGAREQGLELAATEIFDHQTLAELATVARHVTAVRPEQGPVVGELPLTPSQRWFYEQHFGEPQHYNQATLLEVGDRVEIGLLERSLGELLVHHDALRMRFEPRGETWQQICPPPANERQLPFTQVDLARLEVEQQRATVESSAAGLQTSLDLLRGPLLRAVFFRLGASGAGRLLVVVHHLVVDGVSWRVLLEDLQTAYRQLAGGLDVALPTKTTSLKSWAERLLQSADSAEQLAETPYWLNATDFARPLPVDHPGGRTRNLFASAVDISEWLEVEDTEVLLKELPAIYHAQLHEGLLCAVLQTFAPWIGESAVYLDIEGHGREQIFDGLDLSRTVGWFTALYPLRLELAEGDRPEDALSTVKEAVRAIPNRGLGYGVLRYLSTADGAVEELRQRPPAELSFNYLGQFDQVLGKAGIFTASRWNTGPTADPGARRSHLIELGAMVAGGRLLTTWTFSPNVHRRSTVEHLAQELVGHLRHLADRCRQPAERVDYKPADFPKAKLSQDDLDKVLARLGSRSNP